MDFVDGVLTVLFTQKVIARIAISGLESRVDAVKSLLESGELSPSMSDDVFKLSKELRDFRDLLMMQEEDLVSKIRMETILAAPDKPSKKPEVPEPPKFLGSPFSACGFIHNVKQDYSFRGLQAVEKVKEIMDPQIVQIQNLLDENEKYFREIHKP